MKPKSPSPDRSGNPFVSAAADTKDWNGLLRQFALSGSGAGLAPKKHHRIQCYNITLKPSTSTMSVSGSTSSV